MPDDTETDAGYTPHEIYRLMKAESRVDSLQPQLKQIRDRLSEFSDLVDYEAYARLTPEARAALDEIKNGSNQ